MMTDIEDQDHDQDQDRDLPHREQHPAIRLSTALLLWCLVVLGVELGSETDQEEI